MPRNIPAMFDVRWIKAWWNRECVMGRNRKPVYLTDQWPKVPINTFKETSQLYMHRQLRDEVQVRRKDRWRASEWSGRATVFYLFYICKLSLTSGMKPTCKITAGWTVCGNVRICCWISKVQIIRITNTGPTQSRHMQRLLYYYKDGFMQFGCCCIQ